MPPDAWCLEALMLANTCTPGAACRPGRPSPRRPQATPPPSSRLAAGASQSSSGPAPPRTTPPSSRTPATPSPPDLLSSSLSPPRSPAQAGSGATGNLPAPRGKGRGGCPHAEAWCHQCSAAGPGPHRAVPRAAAFPPSARGRLPCPTDLLPQLPLAALVSRAADVRWIAPRRRPSLEPADDECDPNREVHD